MKTIVIFFPMQLTELFCQAMEEKSGIPLLLSFMCICSEVNIACALWQDNYHR